MSGGANILAEDLHSGNNGDPMHTLSDYNVGRNGGSNLPAGGDDVHKENPTIFSPSPIGGYKLGVTAQTSMENIMGDRSISGGLKDRIMVHQIPLEVPTRQQFGNWGKKTKPREKNTGGGEY